MEMTGIRVRVWMATMRFTLSLLLTVFVALAGVLCAADDQGEFQRRLFERYDQKDVVCLVPGMVLGLDIPEGLQPTFGVEGSASSGPSHSRTRAIATLGPAA